MDPLPQPATVSRSLIAWGEIGDREQGDAADTWRIVLPLLPAESIACVACAAAHMLFVSSFGNVYSCGDNAEGALGHGDRANRSSPCAVAWFEENGVRVAAAMAGSGLIGAHSACISEKGELYCWGVGAACGAGSLEDQLVPRLVEVVEEGEGGEGEGEGGTEAGAAGTAAEEPEESGEAARVVWRAAACGGGFTVAITNDGRVYSWGMWARGRLGLGEPPELHHEQPGKRKVPRFKLFPQRVAFDGRRVRGAKVACGDAHTLLIDSEQQLWAWGSNTMGQLGTGLNEDQALADSPSPVLVPPFVKGSDRDDSPSTAVCVQFAACGVSHSLVIDSTGSIWTWGARGRACLGHNDAVISRSTVAENPSLLTTEVNFSKLQDETDNNPAEAIAWASSWSKPRRLAAVGGLQFASVDGGEQHSAAATTDGHVFVWGEGSALSSQSSVPSPVQCTRAWLPGLSSVHAAAVKCAGRFSIVVAEGDAGAHALTRPLYRRSMAAVASLSNAEIRGRQRTESERESDVEADEDERLLHSTLCQHGRLDCVLLVQGKLLFAHRAVLAKRSSLFRELLLAEAPLHEGELTRILLADVHYDTATALLEFVYTDTVSLSTLAIPTMADNLHRAARQFRLPKLQQICEQWVVMRRALEIESDSGDDVAELERQGEPGEQDKEEAGSTLAAELSELVDDMEYADVCFLTPNGTPIYAHMFILEARSPYFRRVFQDVPLEDSLSPGKYLSIVVPDSRDSMLRLLAYVYTQQLVETSHEALMDGIVTADRYNALDMKEACASAIQLTRENLAGVLEVLQRVEAPTLRERAVDFVAQNLADLQQDTTLLELLDAKFSDIAHRAHEQRRRREVVLGAPIFSEPRKKKDDEEELLSANVKFPWSTIGVAAICVLLYRELIRVVAFGPVVPVVNLLTLVAVAYYVYQQLKS